VAQATRQNGCPKVPAVVAQDFISARYDQQPRSLAVSIGPGLVTFTFAYFIDVKQGWDIPGSPRYFDAALLFIAMFMSTRILDYEPSSTMEARVAES
jgi:hypothetical protein